MRELLTVAQLADGLQLGIGTIYYWVHRREIPFVKLGKHLRFDLNAVLNYFRDATRAKERSAGLRLRKVVDDQLNRSLTARDPDHADFRGKE